MSLSAMILILVMGQEPALEMLVQLPKLEVRPYHRPYVAIWIETLDREGVHTIAVWHEQDDWLKDMRQWWRKLGRSGKPPYDGVSGATRKAGSYRVVWDGLDAQGKRIVGGEYYLNIEVAREEGGREVLRQKITLGGDQPQSFGLVGQHEIGIVDITVREAQP